jgi:hypothetical protein
MSLPESEDRNPYYTVGIVGALRFKGKSYEEIAEYLRFNSVEEMRALLESWELPDWLVGAETNSDKKRVHEKSTPRLRGVGPAKELPPAGNATELFKERLEALLKDAELLKHIDESLHGRYFARTNVETADVLHGYSPDDEGFWERDALIRLPGSVELSPSEIEATLISVYALAGGRMDLLLEALHPDPSSVGANTREEIRQYIEGSRPDDKRDGLKVLARQLATWVRGSEVRRGMRSGLSEMDHAVASITTKYRKDGLTDEEITRKLTHLKKEDGTSYSTKDVTELGDLGLSWS